MKFFYCFILLFTLVTTDLYAGALESEVKKARETKPKDVIKCHPDGKDGGVTPLKAMQLLKPGMTLHLLPAQYWSTLEIPQDRVIITTEGKKIHYSIRLKGRDCILKSVNCNAVSVVDDAVIVDSVIDYLSIGSWEYDTRLKIKMYLYNTALINLSTHGGENNSYSIDMKNCLVKGTISNYSNTKMSITDSVLSSDEIIFSFTDYENKKGRLLLKNNLLYGKTGYAKMEYSPSAKKNGVTVVDPKDIRKIWSVAMSGKHVHEEPKFQSHQKLFLAEDSPGKGRGLIPAEHPVFEIMKNQKEDDQESLEDRGRRLAKEREERRARWQEEREKRRKEREEREARDNDKDPIDEGEIGDLPKPPE